MSIERLTAALAGRYRIDGVLGVGGMATVYRAEDLKHHRDVAIKVMLPDLAATMGAERFLREVEIAARLSHPNVLPVYDSGQADGMLYYVMPLVEDETLEAQLAREKQLPVGYALRIAREVAEALGYAHARGIVHRDIKPANILLNSGHAMVADFGIARLTSVIAGAGHALTQTGFSVGTPQYMSPEQASGEAGVDGRTDIYALGCVLYEMLAGEPPFSGPTPAAIIARSMTEQARPLQGTRPTISPALNAVVATAMAKTPADRYATAAEFAAALVAAEDQSRAASASGATPTAVIPSAPTRWPRAAVVAAAAVVVVAVSAAGMKLFTPSASASTAKSVAVLPFVNSGPAEQAYFADGIVDELRDKLARLQQLTVIASSSADQYRQTAKSGTQIAKELRVDQLLMGRVSWGRGAGDVRQVRVVTELVNGETGAVTWRQSFDADSADAFSIQGRIATAVASALGAAVPADAVGELSGRGTTSDAAYEAFLKGTALTGNLPTTSRTKSAFFEEAVALDSTFARAWGALGGSLSELYFNGARDRATGERARYAVERALRLAPDSTRSHVAAATYYQLVANDPAAVRRALDRALALDSNNASVLASAANADIAEGAFDRAVARLTRARMLDPRSRLVLNNLIDVHIRQQRLDAAVPYADELLAITPVTYFSAQRIAMLHLARGDSTRARQAVQGAMAANSVTDFVAYFAGYYELSFVFGPAERALLFRLTPAAFDDDRAWWAQSMAAAAMQQGDHARAQAYADSGLALSKKASDDRPDDSQARMLYAMMLAWTGRAADATLETERALAGMEKEGIDDPTKAYLGTVAARVYLANDQPDRAMDVLVRVLTRRSMYTRAWFRVDPMLAPLRGNTRFDRMLQPPRV